MSGYLEDTGQTLAQWMHEWGKMEAERIRQVTESHPAWLEAHKDSKWSVKTPEFYQRVWSPCEVR